MNNQDLLYNISLTSVETEDTMNALADKANVCARLQKKIYDQAMQQKKSFEQYFASQQVANAEDVVTEEVVEESSTKNKKKEDKK